MRKRIMIQLTAALVALAASSCDKSITSSVFDATLEISTGVVDDGGKMTFKVFCNESSFTVKNLVCEFSDDNVIANDKTYTVTDGLATFTFTDVTVDEDHNGVLSFSVVGSGGTVIPLSGLYYCQTFRPVMTVTPATVTSGEHLSVRITSNHPYWTLVDVTCTAEIDGVPPAGTYPSGKTMDIEVTEPSSGSTVTHTLSVTVHDEYLGTDKTLTKDFKLN